MTSIHDLYSNSEVSVKQSGYFWNRVNKIFDSSINKVDIALVSLRYVWVRYDHGGISVGRSLRSQLLDQAIDAIKSSNFDLAKRITAVLVAMYHNHEYIEKEQWYDFPLNFGLYGSSLEERIHLSVATIALEADKDIPDISKFKHADFIKMLK